MAHLKLMKLMYLADREAYNRFGRSISGDRAFSLANGPVLSYTLDLMDGDVRYTPDGWDTLISAKANNELSLLRPIGPGDLDELSAADVEVLEDVFATYGTMGRWELVELTHKLPEWTDPDGSSLPIATHDILNALGKKPGEIADLVVRMEEDRAVDALLASL